jgi:NAD+ kinase
MKKNIQKISLDKVGIVYNTNSNGYEDVVTNIETVLQKNGIYYSVNSLDNLDKEVSFVIVVGGDGTLLKTARFYSKYGVPVFGFNLGRLGFLAQSSSDDIETAINKIIKGETICEERLMLSVKPGNLVALNDIVIKSESFSRTARLFVSVNGDVICNYLADGIIISTPTGSTAYNISAGGPILVPRLNALVIVPICPHSLNTRPIVIPSNEKIEITSMDHTKKLKVCADGQNTYTVSENMSIKVRRHKNNAKLVLLDNISFYSVIRQKLNWSISNIR